MKNRFYLALAAVTLWMTSCSQDEPLAQSQGGTNTLTATIEGASRSAVTDGGVFSWTSGDEISVWVGNKYDTYTFDATTTNSFNAPENPGTPQGYAIYPAHNNHGDGDLSNGGLPTIMLANTYDYGSTNAPMLAKVENGTLAFKHLGGVMRFVVKNVPNSTTSFKFTANKKITGDFSIATANGENVIQAGDNATGNNEVTINYEIGGVQDQMIFYVPLPVGEYGEYTVTVGNMSHTSNNVTNTIARGTLLLMPVFTYTDTELKKDENGSYVALEGGEQTMATGDGEVLIDAAALSSGTEAVLNLNYTPSASNSELNISDGSADATDPSESKATVNVTPQGSEDIETLTINAPTLTVNLAAGTYGTVNAKTATETLVIGGGVTINALTVNGGNIKLEGDATINSLSVPEGSNITLNLNEKNLTLQNGNYGIINKGTLVIENGTISSTNTTGAVLNYNANTTNTGAAHLTLNDVVVNAQEMAVICWSMDYTSSPNDATQPTTSLTINGGEFTSSNSYAVKSWGFCRMTFDGAVFEGFGGVSCESSYLTMTDCTCEATGDWYDLHVYCAKVIHSDCTFKGEDKNFYIQIYDETNPSNSYGSSFNGTRYFASDVVSGTGVIAKYVTTEAELRAALDNGIAVVLGAEIKLLQPIIIESGEAAVVDLSDNMLRLNGTTTTNVQYVGDITSNIVNSGKLILKNGRYISSASASVAVFNYNGQTKMDYVDAETFGSCIWSVSTDWNSVPGVTEQKPTTTLVLDACSFVSGSVNYVIKTMGYNDVKLTKTDVCANDGGALSCEFSYLEVLGGKLLAKRLYYGLHVYCSVVKYISTTITGADPTKDIYVQIYDENDSSYSYDCKLGETTYTTSDVESGNKGVFIDVD